MKNIRGLQKKSSIVYIIQLNYASHLWVLNGEIVVYFGGTVVSIWNYPLDWVILRLLEKNISKKGIAIPLRKKPLKKLNYFKELIPKLKSRTIVHHWSDNLVCLIY